MSTMAINDKMRACPVTTNTVMIRPYKFINCGHVSYKGLNVMTLWTD